MTLVNYRSFVANDSYNTWPNHMSFNKTTKLLAASQMTYRLSQMTAYLNALLLNPNDDDRLTYHMPWMTDCSVHLQPPVGSEAKSDLTESRFCTRSRTYQKLNRPTSIFGDFSGVGFGFSHR